MPGVSFLLPIEFDLAAAFLFALTGVWLAARRGHHTFRAPPPPVVAGAPRAVLAGCALFVALSDYYGLNTNYAAWIAAGCTLALRLLALRFRWSTRAL